MTRSAAMRSFLAALLFVIATAPSLAEERTGVVVSVHDGDTLTVLVEKQQIKVRLAEIDAPELRQAFGQRSRQSLTGLCFQETARLEMIARDRYGRAVGKVECAGKDAGAHQVSAGMVRVYDRYGKPSPLSTPCRTRPRQRTAACERMVT